ncbi:MAG: curlin [Alphaproteobacteria bacterium]|nr:curlin [Alphaproteobacteria bacterium]
MANTSNTARVVATSCKLLSAFGLSFALSGCGTFGSFYQGQMPATVGDMTTQNMALREISPPRERVRVAVYRFPDLTGQYKERDLVQSLSRAVPQSGEPLLMKALQDAGNGQWFSILDRASLQDVVQERQIIERMREQYRGETPVDPSVLGPMMHAGIIITGGIVGYDTSLQTGGIGARYLGIGAYTEWKYDIVTVNLRAISSETGEVLASVVARKPLASIKGQGDVFRFVELDKLLESEVGLATNEPRQIAVQQAIEKGVMGLIAEGAINRVWSFQSAAEEAQFIAAYRQQLYDGAAPGGVIGTPPDTRGAAVIPATYPAQRRVRAAPAPARVQRNMPAPSQAVPLQAAPVPPPPPEGDETLG